MSCGKGKRLRGRDDNLTFEDYLYAHVWVKKLSFIICLVGFCMIFYIYNGKVCPESKECPNNCDFLLDMFNLILT